MISKDVFFNLLYIKSKMSFLTYSQPLSKLVKQLKLRLLCNFERFLLGDVNVTLIFLKIAAPQSWHTFRGCRLYLLQTNPDSNVTQFDHKCYVTVGYLVCDRLILTNRPFTIKLFLKYY